MSIKSLEFIENIFTSISEDSSIPFEIKPYLMRLQTPVIKASDDRRFFSDPLHPVRITLHLLTKISASGKNMRELAINISGITDKLIHSINISTDDFANANRSLIELINDDEKNSLINKYEKNEKLKIINAEKSRLRQQVITELQEIISDNRIPMLAHELTLKIWPQFMFKKCIVSGVNSVSWMECINQFRKVIDFLQPVQDINRWKYLSDSYESFSDAIEGLLKSSDISKERIRINTEALRSAIRENILKFERENQNLFVKFEKSREKMDSEKDVDVGKNKLRILPASVKVGEWYDLFTSENSAANRLKLSLMIEEEGKLIFVDHRGIKGMVKDADVFAEELSRYLSKPVRSKKPRFVYALNELIDKIHRFNG